MVGGCCYWASILVYVLSVRCLDWSKSWGIWDSQIALARSGSCGIRLTDHASLLRGQPVLPANLPLNFRQIELFVHNVDALILTTRA